MPSYFQRLGQPVASARAPWVKKVVTGELRMLLYQGSYLPKEIKKVRVTQDEILAAIRSAGIADQADVEAVVLETDGKFSVIRGEAASSTSTLRDVRMTEQPS